eukprot:7389882-Prymnesium_polylepis.1
MGASRARARARARGAASVHGASRAELYDECIDCQERKGPTPVPNLFSHSHAVNLTAKSAEWPARRALAVRHRRTIGTARVEQCSQTCAARLLRSV